ncbi:hypothetical protein BDN72DRAFT_846778 [Pluteus cervinus]|uniref:Uncharacterized protein n=1 Tax=Pluteus cervinus TaxID=181527 RepID=A0ACD3AG18_9AGAR|nr:hypothetical protein BDN72DRAFT_846778 [Pluteus cervinus]
MNFPAYESPASSPSLSPFGSPRHSPCTTPSPHGSPKIYPQHALPSTGGSYLVLVQDKLELRVLLRNRLQEYNFRGMSGGFPFRILSRHGQLFPCFDNYEFKEPLHTSTGTTIEATVSFTNPQSDFAGNNRGLFSWSICLPTSAKSACLRSSQLDGRSAGSIVAAVRMDPALQNTTWFQSDQFMKALYNALAFSLEQSCVITIQRSRTNAAEAEWYASDFQNGSGRTVLTFGV